MARVLISEADGRRSKWEMAPDSYVGQRVSRVEWVTGIEPALSAWESDTDLRSTLPWRI